MPEITVNNDKNAIRLRKFRSILGLSGKGVIILALWSVARTIIQLVFAPADSELGVSTVVIVAFYVFLFMVVAADLAMRIVVGVNAGKESRGVKRGYGYIVLSIILLLIRVFSIVSFVVSFKTAYINLGVFATVLTELVSMVVLVELIVSGIIVKRAGK